MDAHPEIEHTEFFPFRSIGLRSNPFRVLTEAEWMEVAILPRDIEKLVPDGFLHLQILGNTGRGKTTTLLAIKHAFKTLGRSAIYEYLPFGQSHFKTALDGIDLFILDEAQRLSMREMRRLLSKAARYNTERPRLVVSSHRDLSPHFHRLGLPLQTSALDRVTAPFLEKLLSTRLRFFSTMEQEQVRFTEESVTALLDRFGSDLRAMEKHLYEVFQTLSKQHSVFERPCPLVLHPKHLFAAP